MNATRPEPKPWVFRDAMAVAVLGGILILLGEGVSSSAAQTALRLVIRISSSPVLDFLAKVGIAALGILAIFGGLLVIVGGLAIGRGALDRGVFLLTLGTGASVLGICVRVAVVVLENRELRAIHWLITTLSGLGLIAVVVARILATRHRARLRASAGQSAGGGDSAEG